MNASPKSIPMGGTIDFSTLAKPAPAPEGNTGSGFVVDIEESEFPAIAQHSARVPIIMVMWAAFSPASKQTAAELAALAEEYQGRFVLVRIDGERAPQLRQALQVTSFPKTIAILQGKPVPLFDGNATREQIRPIVEQVLTLAAQNGITATVAAKDGAAEAQDVTEAEEPQSPEHQRAFEAIEAGDFAAAKTAFAAALAQNPRDELAKVGILQTELLERTQHADPAAVFSQAKENLQDVNAQLAASDLELASGRIDEAFGRLLSLIGRSNGEEQELARQRIVSYFEMVGNGDASVQAARRRLAMLLN